ncbi:prolipoprotein diacylglyceryl transferase [uncultured Kordia sp.]|uniref:prolipoprotein diacylglyceryl transferase n=1 Tax=uncultured Kordia sp. TaxID=507699 RepID=UPI002623FCD6|nr:prolipoprotein diacylglyceryl transferase [uncultured Kordia sp.]
MHLLSINWNPSEVLLNLGPIQIRYYSLMFIIAFSLGYYITKKIYDKEGIETKLLDSLFMYAVIATLLGARLGEVFFYNWDYYQNNLIEILLPIKADANATLFGFIEGYKFTGFAGLASHGAAIGIIVAMYLYRRKYQYKSLLWILDRIVIAVSLGGIFVRIGNFFNSEIVGKTVAESFPTAVRFIRNASDLHPKTAMNITNLPTSDAAYEAIANNPQFVDTLNDIPFRHPAQLYESFCYVFVFLILWYVYWKTEKKNKQGYIFGLFLVLLWTVRFLVEFVKESQGGFEDKFGNILSTGQWLSIPFIIAGFYFMFRNTNKTDVNTSKTTTS